MGHGCTSANHTEARRRTATHGLKAFHEHMSENQKEARKDTATHALDEVSWLQVRKSHGGEEGHSNSQPGNNFICTSVNQMEARRGTETPHKLEGNS